MTDAIYSWMRNLAYYFIFLSAVMNFIPDNSFRKYIKYFMGLILMLLLLSPILQFFKLDKDIEFSFSEYIKEEEVGQMEEWREYAEGLEQKYRNQMAPEEVAP